MIEAEIFSCFPFSLTIYLYLYVLDDGRGQEVHLPGDILKTGFIPHLQGHCGHALNPKPSNFPFRISFSMGYDVYDYSSGMSKDQFLNHIDALMYQNKKINLA
jgi:hypothetical protein